MTQIVDGFLEAAAAVSDEALARANRGRVVVEQTQHAPCVFFRNDRFEFGGTGMRCA